MSGTYKVLVLNSFNHQLAISIRSIPAKCYPDWHFFTMDTATLVRLMSLNRLELKQ